MQEKWKQNQCPDEKKLFLSRDCFSKPCASGLRAFKGPTVRSNELLLLNRLSYLHILSPLTSSNLLCTNHMLNLCVYTKLLQHFHIR